MPYQGKRLDGRDFSETRPLVIETDVIKKANGSARGSWWHWSNCRRQGRYRRAFWRSWEQGCVNRFGRSLRWRHRHTLSGPPDEEVVELARVVDRGVRESEMIDPSFCARAWQNSIYNICGLQCAQCWRQPIWCNIICHCCSITYRKLPVFEMQDEKVVDSGNTQPMPVTSMPVSLPQELVIMYW